MVQLAESPADRQVGLDACPCRRYVIPRAGQIPPDAAAVKVGLSFLIAERLGSFTTI